MNKSQTLSLSRAEQRQIDQAVALLMRCPASVRHSVLIAAANVGRTQESLDAALMRLDAVAVKAKGGLLEHAA